MHVISTLDYPTPPAVSQRGRAVFVTMAASSNI
jgi:hypothetical protein